MTKLSLNPTPLDQLYRKYHPKYAEARKEDFLQDVGGVFFAFPEIETISLIRYTPWGFNDGDPQTVSFYASVNLVGEKVVTSTGNVCWLEDLDEEEEEEEALRSSTSCKPLPQEVFGDVKALLEGMEAQFGEVYGDAAVRIDRRLDGVFVTHAASYESEY